MFAEHGISPVPLRDIGIAAGQKNNVAVQYHFGDRTNLVRAIAAYRAAASEEVRTQLLSEVLSRSEPVTVQDIVGVFVRSLACHLDGENHYLAFLSRYAVELGGFLGLQKTAKSETIPTLLGMLRRLLPDHESALLEERWMVVVTSAIHTLARYQTAQRTGGLPAPLDPLLDDLIALLAAGLEARPSASLVGALAT